MAYRLTKDQLFEILEEWNRRLKRKVHLIACGGTAMTLLGIKPSTKDVDFMAPVLAEYDYLTRNLSKMGYERETQSGWKRKGEIFQFDIFRGKQHPYHRTPQLPPGSGTTPPSQGVLPPLHRDTERIRPDLQQADARD